MKKLLEKEIKKIRPDSETLNKITKNTNLFIEKLRKNIKKNKIKAEVFLGGSFAKKTLIKKDKYDVDVYIIFKKNPDADKVEKILKNFKIKRIHGSRDYFEVLFNKTYFEVIPILKIVNPEEAENITDLSPFHVYYVKKKIEKNPKLENEILLAKQFCYANDVYGAESYIHGFSGYALELLIIYYRSFERFLKELIKKDKIVIDSEKHYSGKKKILNELNPDKLDSPIVLIDPTYKHRNALASLSEQTFDKFKQVVKEFLKNPSHKLFEKQEINEKNYTLIFEVKTNRQEGDIAGSKLKKFFRLFTNKLKKNFDIKDKEFCYNDKKTGKFYYKLKKKKNIIIEGPPINLVDNVKKFKKQHKNCYIKNHTVYAKEKPLNKKEFIKQFKKNNKTRMKEMGITSLKLKK